MNDLDPREHRQTARDFTRWHVIYHRSMTLGVFYLKNGNAGELEHFASTRHETPDGLYIHYLGQFDHEAWRVAMLAAATREAHRRNVITQKRRREREQRGGM